MKLLLFIVSIFALGLLLALLARWARTENRKLKAVGRDHRLVEINRALAEGDIKGAAKIHYMASLPKFAEITGKFLAAVVIILVVGLLLWVVISYAIFASS